MTLLKHDLHFTHKDPRVLAFCTMHNICLLYVPAGCTDLLQECDTVVNKVFKTALKSAFRDHLYLKYAEYRAQVPAPHSALFRPKLTMGALKPHLCGFVEQGIAALRTPAMRATIAKAFAQVLSAKQLRVLLSPQSKTCYPWWRFQLGSRSTSRKSKTTETQKITTTTPLMGRRSGLETSTNWAWTWTVSLRRRF